MSEFDKAAFTSHEGEIQYWGERIRQTMQYLEYLKRQHQDAVKRLGNTAVAGLWGDTEQAWLGNVEASNE